MGREENGRPDGGPSRFYGIAFPKRKDRSNRRFQLK
jgi:hypothetical protein